MTVLFIYLFIYLVNSLNLTT